MTKRYYKRNREETLSMYDNYMKVIRQLPFSQLTFHGSAGLDKTVILDYSMFESGGGARLTFSSSGEFISGYNSTGPITESIKEFRTDEFKKLVSDFAKTNYLFITYESNYAMDAVFFALDGARYNSRDYIGILITSRTDIYYLIKKVEDKVYVFETTVF